MSTYPVTTIFADGTETTQEFSAYRGPHPIKDPGAVDMVETIQQNPAAREIKVCRVKNGVTELCSHWVRETAPHLNGAWYGKSVD